MLKHPGCAALWPTPRATVINETLETARARMKRLKSEGRQTGGARNLQSDVQAWATQQARDYRSGDPERFTTKERSKNLNDHVMRWPTPTAVHVDRGNHDEPIENYQARVTDYEEGRAKGKPGKSLGLAVRWPTPGGKITPNVVNPEDLVNRDGAPWTVGKKPVDRRTGQDRQTTLVDAVRSWPTPTVQDSANNAGPAQHLRNTKPLNVEAGLHDPDNNNTNGSHPGRLNPTWVEVLMGFEPGWTWIEIEPTDSAHSGTQ
tara:strand:+ start:1973 stop:2752 length:780 start_codon:yes stop_codon:yes gene_type:complete